MLKSQVVLRIYNTIVVKNGFNKLTCQSYMLNNPLMILGRDKYPIHYPTREEGIIAGKNRINHILNQGVKLRDICIEFKLSHKHLIGNFPRSLNLGPDTCVWDIID